MKDDTNSLRNFSRRFDRGLWHSHYSYRHRAIVPSWLLTLQGWQWIVAFSAALLVAVAGAVYMFRAKLPVYRQHRFFTFGSRGLPASSIPLYRRGCRLSIIGIILATILLIPWLLFGELSLVTIFCMPPLQ